MKSIEIYRQLEQETGQDPGWHASGSIRTADNPDRMDELGYMYSTNRCLGLNVEWVTPDDIAKLHPMMNVDGLLGAPGGSHGGAGYPFDRRGAYPHII